MLSGHVLTFSPESPPTSQAAAANALKWLDANQNLDGSYGSTPQYYQHWAAAAAYALWLNNSSSLKASKSYTWIASQMDNYTSGVWYEADIPGEILYSLAVSGNLGLLHNSSDYTALADFQQPNGGFAGFAEPPSYAPVASAVDTDMALWGLIHARSVNASSQEKATSYLFSLQNTTDGSFALTSDTFYSSFESLAALALVLVPPGPELGAYLPHLVVCRTIAGIGALAVIVGVVVYFVRSNKTQTPVSL